jgi:uncharacterized protein (DUF2062 family)
MKDTSLNPWHQKLRDHFREVLALKTEPRAIAFGFALGTCISVLPTIGFGVLIGVALTVIFKRLSKIALFAAIAFWNPLFIAPIYWLSFRIGDWLFAGTPPAQYEIVWLNEVIYFTRRFLFGNLIVGALLTGLSYTAALAIARKIQSRRSRKPGAASAPDV